jgi:hypothetical protein
VMYGLHLNKVEVIFLQRPTKSDDLKPSEYWTICDTLK